MPTDIYTNNIHASLRHLLKEKSARDRVPFTAHQLAKALNMPHSMLAKLMHTDVLKRVINPRIDTLTRIVDFFRNDGFDITIEDVLNGLHNSKSAEVQQQFVGSFIVEKTIPAYSFNLNKTKKIGTFNVKLTTDAQNITAYLSDEDIEPMFKKGSLFIIDTELTPDNGMLVAVQTENHPKILIRMLHIEDNEAVLKGYSDATPDIGLTPVMNYLIIGVVIQVNAKT